MNKYTVRNIRKKNSPEQGFTIVETIVTLVVVALFLTMFFQGYLLIVSQQSAVTRQSKADSVAQENLRQIAAVPSFKSSYSPTSCPAAGWDLTDSAQFSSTVSIGSSEEMTMYCVTDLDGPMRVVSKVTFNINGINRTAVYAKILN